MISENGRKKYFFRYDFHKMVEKSVLCVCPSPFAFSPTKYLPPWSKALKNVWNVVFCLRPYLYWIAVNGQQRTFSKNTWPKKVFSSMIFQKCAKTRVFQKWMSKKSFFSNDFAKMVKNVWFSKMCDFLTVNFEYFWATSNFLTCEKWLSKNGRKDSISRKRRPQKHFWEMVIRKWPKGYDFQKMSTS